MEDLIKAFVIKKGVATDLFFHFGMNDRTFSRSSATSSARTTRKLMSDFPATYSPRAPLP